MQQQPKAAAADEKKDNKKAFRGVSTIYYLFNEKITYDCLGESGMAT